MTEYRKFTADELTTEPVTVEVYNRASGEWIPMQVRVFTVSGGAEFIKTTNAAGGGMTYPKGHGLLARVAVDPIARQNVRTARGTIHISTIGRTYKLHGTPQENRAEVAAGKADCGALTSTAAEVVTDPATCPKCIAARQS